MCKNAAPLKEKYSPKLWLFSSAVMCSCGMLYVSIFRFRRFGGDCVAKKKKKKNGQPGQALKREPRLRKARQWLVAYEGGENRIVRNYRDKFKVDIPTALRDLQDIGHVFAPEYLEAVMRGEEQRPRQRAMKKQKQAERECDWRDDRFYFIAGYTSGGAPYGVTWEEMGLMPYEDEYELMDGNEE
jgi:hypothetical protein